MSAERVDPPFDGTLEFYRAWAKKHGGTVKVVHKNPNGVISITQGGFNHVYRHDKYGKGDGKYSWSSTMKIGFMAECVSAYMEAHPEDMVGYADLSPQDNWLGESHMYGGDTPPGYIILNSETEI